MRRPKSITRRLAMVGSAAFIVGGVLVGAAAVASATGPAITLDVYKRQVELGLSEPAGR